MNRNDILKKCVDRGVAGETEVGAVSHLFYVYLLSALQRGQRVEVPNFGTFATHVAGVKKIRKIPFFEPDRDLSEKVNRRFADLKYLVVGRYEQIPVTGEVEYRGREAPYEELPEQLGKESIVDAHKEVSLDDYQQSLSAARMSKQQQEEPIMPKLNLRDEGLEGEGEPLESEKQMAPPPTLREVGTAGGRMSPMFLIALIIIVLGVGVFALNYFNVVHLWGKKAPKVAEMLPEPALPTPESPEQGVTPSTEQEMTPPLTEPAPEPTPLPTEKAAPKAKVSLPPSGKGPYTVQVSSWVSKMKAESEASKLTAAGFEAFVEEAMVGGETWHRVRVGRYASSRDAKEAAMQLENILEDGIWVDRIGGQ